MDLPWYADVGFACAVTWLTIRIGSKLSGNSADRQRECAEAKQLARRLADRGDYYIKGVANGLSAITLTVHTADQERIVDQAEFPKGHPDGGRILTLERLDRVRFDCSDDPIVKKKPACVGNYLRLRAD
jgi:hypothetical protein